MAEEGQALSLGTAIGLGYKTKDIGPQLLKFQAEQLAAGSARKAAAHKQKQAEYDKIYNDMIKLDDGSFHKSVQGALNSDKDKSIGLINDAIQKGKSPQEVMGILYDLTKQVTARRNQSDERKVIQKDIDAGLPVPDVFKTALNRPVDAVDPTKILTAEEETTLKTLGYPVNVVEGTLGYQGNKSAGIEAGIRAKTYNVQGLEKEGVSPEVKTIKAPVGYQDEVYFNFSPTEKQFVNEVNTQLEEPGALAVEFSKIAKAQGKTETALMNEITAASNATAAANGTEATPYPIVAKDYIRNYYVQNVMPGWIADKSVKVDAQKNVVVRAPRPDDDNPPNPSEGPVYQSEFVSPYLSKSIAEQPELQKYLEGMSDTQIIAAYRDPSTITNKVARDRMTFIVNAAKKQTNLYPTQKYYAAFISNMGESIVLKNGDTIKVDQLYYNDKDDSFHAKGSANVTQSGKVVNIQNKDYKLDVDDLQTLQSASGGTGGAVYKNAIINWDKSAAKNKVPKISSYIESKKTGRRVSSGSATPAEGPIQIKGVGGN